MLKITIPSRELFDESTMEFLETKEYTIQLEHSLVSISKWESKWNIPFFSKEDKTVDQVIDYARCMTITQNIDDKVYNGLTQQNIDDINKYINAPMTATTFRTNTPSRSSEIVTSELIYYWMIALNIPMECQRWHINRLLTLIKICNIKNDPGKKMSRGEIMSRNAALNKARRAQYHSRG